MYYKVCLGQRRYTTEWTDYVEADSSEEACRRAISLNPGMRFAIAQKIKLTAEIVEQIMSANAGVRFGRNMISHYGHDGFVVNLGNGNSLFFADKSKAIGMFLWGINNL